MKSTTNVILNMQMPNYSVVVYAVQGDLLSREVVATLLDGNTAWTPPEGSVGTVRYLKPDGTSGFYTEDEGHHEAVVWTANVATIRLAEQALTVAGQVVVQVSFYSPNAERLSAFNFMLEVERNPLSDEEFESTDYYSILADQIASVLDATVFPPSINSSNHWVLYNPETHQYYDSGVDATGPQGEAGPSGAYMSGLTKISGTGAAGTSDTYRCDLSNGSSGGTFSVYNGADGQGSPTSSIPLMDGTAAVGTAVAYARGDHVHPSDTSRAEAAKVINNVILVTLEDVASDNLSFSVTGVTSDHELIQEGCAYLSNPSAAGSDLTITTGSGTVTVSGTLTGTTDIVMTLGVITNKQTA